MYSKPSHILAGLSLPSPEILCNANRVKHGSASAWLWSSKTPFFKSASVQEPLCRSLIFSTIGRRKVVPSIIWVGFTVKQTDSYIAPHDLLKQGHWQSCYSFEFVITQVCHKNWRMLQQQQTHEHRQSGHYGSSLLCMHTCKWQSHQSQTWRHQALKNTVYLMPDERLKHL